MLTDAAVLSTLKSEFVNCWLLAKDLERIAADSDDEDLKELCALIRRNYGYPVDTVLVSSELELLGHMNVGTAMQEGSRGYLAFLRRALGFEPEAPPDRPAPEDAGSDPPRGTFEMKKIALSPETPRGSFLDVFRSSPEGERSFAFFLIELDGFPPGRTIEVEVQVGGADLAGSFELCVISEVAPGQMALQPVRSATGVHPGETRTIVYELGSEQSVQLGVFADPSPEGERTNAFLTKVTVRED